MVSYLVLLFFFFFSILNKNRAAALRTPETTSISRHRSVWCTAAHDDGVQQAKGGNGQQSTVCTSS